MNEPSLASRELVLNSFVNLPVFPVPRHGNNENQHRRFVNTFGLPQIYMARRSWLPTTDWSQTSWVSAVGIQSEVPKSESGTALGAVGQLHKPIVKRHPCAIEFCNAEQRQLG